MTLQFQALPEEWLRRREGLGVWEGKGKVAAVGVGVAPTSRRWDWDPQTSVGANAVIALRKAMDDAGVTPDQVDGLVVVPDTTTGRFDWPPVWPEGRDIPAEMAELFTPTDDPRDGMARLSVEWVLKNMPELTNVKFTAHVPTDTAPALIGAIEAINHAKAANVPLIVAINKMDLPDANPDKVKQELLQYEVIPEEMGGDVQVVEVSAIQKHNLDGLEEVILLQAELLELQSNPKRSAEGVVVEAKLDRGRGAVATVLVQRGTLRIGDIFVAGSQSGKVRALLDSHGNNVDEAMPSMPVEVLGLNGAPDAGGEFNVVETEARAREISNYRQRLERERRATAGTRGTLEEMFSNLKTSDVKEFPLLFKADVRGSLEAITAAVDSLGNDEVKAQVLHAGVGGITESDIDLARASNAVVIGFNVRANPQAKEMARQENIEIRYYSIIYELVDDLKKAMSGLLDPEIKETIIGGAEVLEVFNISKLGMIAGCRINSGIARRKAKVRLLRDNVVIHTGSMKSLKRFKDDANEVREGNECGVSLDRYQDIQSGDQLEFFEVEEVQRSL